MCVCVKIQLDNMVSMLCGNILRVVLIRIAKNGRNTSYPCRLGSRRVKMFGLKCDTVPLHNDMCISEVVIHLFTALTLC